MSYRIVLYRNGKKNKIIFKSDKLNGIKTKYIHMIKHNEVIIPKKLINNLKFKPVTYELLLMESKDVSKGDIVIRDSMGKLIRDREIEPGWLILERSNWKIEETFKVFGKDNRMDCVQIVKQLLLPNKTPKQVYCVLNKLIIEDDDEHMEIITCKNEYESGRLHDALRDICKKFEVQSIVFFGKATPENRSKIYPKILKITGWKKYRVYRKSTRP